MPKKAGAKDVLPKIRREIIKTLSNVDKLGGGTGVVDRLTDAFIENPIAFLQAAGRYMPQEVQQEHSGDIKLTWTLSSPTNQDPSSLSSTNKQSIIDSSSQSATDDGAKQLPQSITLSNAS